MAPPNETTEELELPSGLVFSGGTLEVEYLLGAYRSGCYPWTVDPITWWSPDPRAVFELDTFHVPRSLKRRLRQNPFRITYDQAFKQVIRGCADRTTGENSWITEEFIDAYRRLHARGHAHSVEAWQDDRLVGGIYGVSIGGLFAGESMFHRESDASKIALYELHRSLNRSGYTLFDIQMITPVTALLGAVEIPRTQYLSRLRRAVRLSRQFPRSL